MQVNSTFRETGTSILLSPQQASEAPNIPSPKAGGAKEPAQDGVHEGLWVQRMRHRSLKQMTV